MKIEARKTSSFVSVKIVEGSTTIDLGFLSDDERDELACELLCGVYAIGPKFSYDCDVWFAAMLKRSQIELPEPEGQDED